MERHPLIFLSVLIALGVMLGAIIGLQLITARQQERQLRTLRAIRDDLDELADTAAGRKR